MKNQISSSTTFVFKFIFSPIAIFVLGYGIYFQMKLQEPSIVILVLLVLCLSFVFFDFLRLKKISVDDTNIYVSNYIKELTMSRNDIKRVAQNYTFTRQAYIYFKNKTGFGKKVVFIPKVKIEDLPLFPLKSKVLKEIEKNVGEHGD